MKIFRGSPASKSPMASLFKQSTNGSAPKGMPHSGHHHHLACLDMHRLEQLLTVDLAPYCTRSNTSRFQGLAARHKYDDPTDVSTTSHGLSGGTPDLDYVYYFLRRFVDKPCAAHVPAHILMIVHSFMGMIMDIKGEFDAAASAHLRSLWCAQRSSMEVRNKNNADQLVVASMCRLAISYGRKGDKKAKTQLLKHAESISTRKGKVGM